MIVVGNDHTVLDRVAADDPARRYIETEYRVTGRRQLMHQLLGRRTAIVDARVVLLQDDHAAALDPVITGIDSGRDEVGERHVGDEAAALVHVQDRLLAFLPLLHRHLAAQYSRIHSHVGDRLGQREGASLYLAILARLRRRKSLHVLRLLLLRAPLVDR